MRLSPFQSTPGKYFETIPLVKDTILAECTDMIRNNETVKLLQMYKAGGQLGGHQQQKIQSIFHIWVYNLVWQYQ